MASFSASSLLLSTGTSPAGNRSSRPPTTFAAFSAFSSRRVACSTSPLSKSNRARSRNVLAASRAISAKSFLSFSDFVRSCSLSAACFRESLGLRERSLHIDLSLSGQVSLPAPLALAGRDRNGPGSPHAPQCWRAVLRRRPLIHVSPGRHALSMFVRMEFFHSPRAFFLQERGASRSVV